MRPPSGPPLLARLSERRFRSWAARTTGSRRLARFGDGSIIYPPALIIGHGRIEVGNDVVVHPGAFLSVIEEHGGTRYDARLVIGDGSRIGADFVIACCGSVQIGERVLTADRVFVGDTYHDYRDPTRPILDQSLRDPRPVSIGAGAFLGINCAVLPGVTIGEGAYVGAGAVVTRDIPPRSVAVGNPATVVRQWDGEQWASKLGRSCA